MGIDYFPSVNFYIPAPSECLSHNGCQITEDEKKLCIL